MTLTKKELRYMREALQGSLKYLWNGKGEISHCVCVCHAINRWNHNSGILRFSQKEKVKDLIHQTIEGHFTYRGWLVAQVGFDKVWTYSEEQIQDGRRRMVLMLIEAIDRKLK